MARKAGITQPVSIETTKGGVKKQESKEKCELVMSHTARRTGATLMYLAGVDIYDIMKITGHTTPEMLKKYIKADQLDVVQKLTDKYDYFKYSASFERLSASFFIFWCRKFVFEAEKHYLRLVNHTRYARI